mmetsp:Transcript_11826/g.24137  ORF Transcript_11826/g.24137 Transcript_11826/m.24137 type:complete len:238 (+) Transcript_11826:736-1449(+)
MPARVTPASGEGARTTTGGAAAAGGTRKWIRTLRLGIITGGTREIRMALRKSLIRRLLVGPSTFTSNSNGNGNSDSVMFKTTTLHKLRVRPIRRKPVLPLLLPSIPKTPINRCKPFNRRRPISPPTPTKPITLSKPITPTRPPTLSKPTTANPPRSNTSNKSRNSKSPNMPENAPSSVSNKNSSPTIPTTTLAPLPRAATPDCPSSAAPRPSCRVPPTHPLPQRTIRMRTMPITTPP